MSDLLEHVKHFLQGTSLSRFQIAYSGGLDSHVLLHLCSRLQDGRQFSAIHINHGLHPDSNGWASHCRQVCGAFKMPLRVIAVHARPGSGQSPEEAARNARYRAFAEHLQADEGLLLAQHQDDQAETVLLQLLRGAGPAGLAGMPASAPLGKGKLLRPLLSFPRRVLREYARAHRLNWLEDPSNQDLSYDRNFLRHHILPQLAKRWPACASTIARSARHCGEAHHILTETAEQMRQVTEAEDGGLEIEGITQFSIPRQRLLLRAWLQKHGFRLPPEPFIHRVLTEVIGAGHDRMPKVIWKEGEIHRFNGKLYVLPPMQPFPKRHYVWKGDSPLVLAGNGILKSEPATGHGIARHWWQQGNLEIRYRQGGESCLLPNRKGHRSLKKLFQEYRIPPWLRERAPLLYIDGQLAAVADFWVCEPFSAKRCEKARILLWESPFKPGRAAMQSRGLVQPNMTG